MHILPVKIKILSILAIVILSAMVMGVIIVAIIRFPPKKKENIPKTGYPKTINLGGINNLEFQQLEGWNGTINQSNQLKENNNQEIITISNGKVNIKIIIVRSGKSANSTPNLGFQTTPQRLGFKEEATGIGNLENIKLSRGLTKTNEWQVINQNTQLEGNSGETSYEYSLPLLQNRSVEGQKIEVNITYTVFFNNELDKSLTEADKTILSIK